MAGPINGSRMEEQGGSTGDDHLNVMTRRSPASIECFELMAARPMRCQIGGESATPILGERKKYVA
jgi:hypothetical protein